MMDRTRTFQVIDRSYLRRVIIHCALIFTGGLFVTSVIFYLLMQQPIGANYATAFQKLSQLQQDILYKSLIIYASTIVFMMGGIIVITTIYSHRVAGPLYRLSLFAKKIGAGEIDSQVSLRQDDAVHALADEMNLLVERYQENLGRVKAEWKELERYENRLEEGEVLGQDDLRDISARAEKISTYLAKYRL